MLFASRRRVEAGGLRMWKDGQRQNAFYRGRWIVAVYFDAMVGEPVRRPPLGKQLFQTVAVRGERASGIIAETFSNQIERTIEPDRDAAARFDERTIGRLHKSAAAQSHDCRLTRLDLCDTMANYFRFDAAEMPFAVF